MTSTKPYLIRAIWQWCIDNGQTPHIVVEVDEHTQVPAGFVKDGQITLNIGLDATHQLDIGNEYISFQARFGGVAQQLFVPIGRVAAVYSRESQEGMGFEVEEAAETAMSANTTTAPAEPVPVIAAVTPDTAPVEAKDTDEPPPSTPSPAGGRPRFTVVK